jgi:hypothetical protein
MSTRLSKDRGSHSKSPQSHEVPLHHHRRGQLIERLLSGFTITHTVNCKNLQLYTCSFVARCFLPVYWPQTEAFLYEANESTGKLYRISWKPKNIFSRHLIQISPHTKICFSGSPIFYNETSKIIINFRSKLRMKHLIVILGEFESKLKLPDLVTYWAATVV